MSKFYYTNVIKSKKNKEFYIGWTNDLIARIEKHNKGLVFATKNSIPYKLVYYEACLVKEEAINRERALKTGFGRRYLKKRIGKV